MDKESLQKSVEDFKRVYSECRFLSADGERTYFRSVSADRFAVDTKFVTNVITLARRFVSKNMAIRAFYRRRTNDSDDKQTKRELIEEASEMSFGGIIAMLAFAGIENIDKDVDEGEEYEERFLHPGWPIRSTLITKEIATMDCIRVALEYIVSCAARFVLPNITVKKAVKQSTDQKWITMNVEMKNFIKNWKRDLTVSKIKSTLVWDDDIRFFGYYTEQENLPEKPFILIEPEELAMNKKSLVQIPNGWLRSLFLRTFIKYWPALFLRT